MIVQPSRLGHELTASLASRLNFLLTFRKPLSADWTVLCWADHDCVSKSTLVALADWRVLVEPVISRGASNVCTPTNGCYEVGRGKTKQKASVRTIHLRYDRQGTWYVSVTQENHPPLSHTPYASTPHALRAFVYEGQQQPFARMLIHVSKNESAVVIRKARNCARDRDRDAHAIDIQSAKAAVARAGASGAALQSLNEFL